MAITSEIVPPTCARTRCVDSRGKSRRIVLTVANTVRDLISTALMDRENGIVRHSGDDSGLTTRIEDFFVK